MVQSASPSTPRTPAFPYPKPTSAQRWKGGEHETGREGYELRAGSVPASSWGHWAQGRDKPLPRPWPRQGEGCSPQIRSVQIPFPSPQFIPCLSCESIRWPNPSWGGLAGALLIMHWQPHRPRERPLMQEGVSKTDDTLFLPPHLRSDSPAGMSVVRSQCSIQATVQVRESDKSKNEVRQVTAPFSMQSAF